MKKSITLKELSKILKVSISTVSKALNDSYEISEITKKRVREAANEYNYKPNRTAMNLKSGRVNTIGVILPSLKNFFLARVLRGIENVIAKTDYNIIISITNESHEKEVQSVLSLANGFVEAIIIAVSEETQVLQDYSHLENVKDKVHLLMFDRVVNTIPCDKVLVDDYDAVLNAVKDLQLNGRKNIALTSTINNLSVGKLRIKGYTDAINEYHKPIIIEGTVEVIKKALRERLKEESIDAIIALDEEASLASFKVGKKEKLLDNGKLSLIGYAGKTISEHLTPSLTTINQHGKKIGRTAAKMILNKLKNENEKSEEIIIKSTLYNRETTRIKE